MPRRFYLVAFMAICSVAAWYRPSPVFAQDKPEIAALPKAETLFETYLEVTGGKKAYEKLRTRTSVGTFEVESLGVRGKIQTWQKSPDLLRSIVEMGELGRSERGVNDGLAWEISPDLGAALLGDEKTKGNARLLDGAEKAFLLREATFNADLNWKKVCASAETVGEETVAEKPAWKVLVKTNDGATLYMYYDQYSNLLVRMDASVKTAMGEVDVQVYPSDYRKSGGILVPFKSTQKMMGITQTATFSSIKFNDQIPEQKFAVPEEVLKIQKQSKRDPLSNQKNKAGGNGAKEKGAKPKQAPSAKP